MRSDFESFAANLAILSLNEIETAIAVLWYLDSTGETNEVTPRRIADLMHDAALSGQINVSRLNTRLKAEPSVIKGRASGTYRIRLSSKPQLDLKFGPVKLTPIAPKITVEIVPVVSFEGTRRYLERLVEQINGMYQLGYYDGCAVLCRRLMESLLIEAFEVAGKGAAIKQGNDYLMLSGVLAAAKSGQHIRLARGIGDAMESVKGMGDAAAHSRSYITTQADIDHLTLNFRRVISELVSLAKIEPRKTG